jgi:hypothetical protein
MIHRQSEVCKCGHSAMVHIGKCWGKIKGKDCTCPKFDTKPTSN